MKCFSIIIFAIFYILNLLTLYKLFLYKKATHYRFKSHKIHIKSELKDEFRKNASIILLTIYLIWKAITKRSEMGKLPLLNIIRSSFESVFHRIYDKIMFYLNSYYKALFINFVNLSELLSTNS